MGNHSWSVLREGTWVSRMVHGIGDFPFGKFRNRIQKLIDLNFDLLVGKFNLCKGNPKIATLEK
jgi:hypothetical protein